MKNDLECKMTSDSPVSSAQFQDRQLNCDTQYKVESHNSGLIKQSC